ncbi:uncharacterized protein BDR25DRAFT_352507 [Lindgomyces ingoldianus]|uniref:Uncharacterized protein n=1 Tax=Lindgomyces ingoldianus TaxID=673940 RepID=A0ACB6R123_9PLEO|nr:uncharacterized protein BDR25DRAFT_352507 [Lindgomyces ingoldianus]KAF2473029.1 hypothetical protein BDR25DRAFT_352507 [Lindgomyces ingoldianus]
MYSHAVILLILSSLHSQIVESTSYPPNSASALESATSIFPHPGLSTMSYPSPSLFGTYYKCPSLVLPAILMYSLFLLPYDPNSFSLSFISVFHTSASLPPSFTLPQPNSFPEIVEPEEPTRSVAALTPCLPPPRHTSSMTTIPLLSSRYSLLRAHNFPTNIPISLDSISSTHNRRPWPMASCHQSATKGTSPANDKHLHDHKKTPGVVIAEYGIPRRTQPCFLEKHVRISGSSLRRVVNRFSILAELDQHANHTKWNFDFLQTPHTSARRRGKRGGKTSKPKFVRQQPYEAPKSERESIEELCKKMAGLCLDDKESSNTGATSRISTDACNGRRQNDFRRTFDEVRHHWIPQFRPNSNTAHPSMPTAPSKAVNNNRINLLLRPERCMTHTNSPPPSLNTPLESAEVRRKESRFFPLSAFLTSPEPTATRHSTSPRLNTSNPIRPSIPKKPLSLVAQTIAQKAAASAACRALTVHKKSIAGHISRPVSPSPLALNSTPFLPTYALSVAPAISSVTSPFTPLAITPPFTASPNLTTSPAVSTVPPETGSPSIISAPRILSPGPCGMPPALPPRPQPPNPPSPIQNCPLIQLPSIPASLASAPLVSPRIQWPETPASFPTTSPILTPTPTSSVYPTPPPPRRIPGLLPASLCLTKPAPEPIVSSAQDVAIPFPLPSEPSLPIELSDQIRKNLKEYLEMGHANPCWCTSHSGSQIQIKMQHIHPASRPTNGQEYEAKLPVPTSTPITSIKTSIKTSININTHPQAQTQPLADTPIPKSPALQATVTEHDASDLDSVTLISSPIDSDFLTPSHSPSAIDSDFEDLSRYEDSVSSSRSESGGEDEWMVVVPEKGYEKPHAMKSMPGGIPGKGDVGMPKESEQKDMEGVGGREQCDNPWCDMTMIVIDSSSTSLEDGDEAVKISFSPVELTVPNAAPGSATSSTCNVRGAPDSSSSPVPIPREAPAPSPTPTNTVQNKCTQCETCTCACTPSRGHGQHSENQEGFFAEKEEKSCLMAYSGVMSLRVEIELGQTELVSLDCCLTITRLASLFQFVSVIVQTGRALFDHEESGELSSKYSLGCFRTLQPRWHLKPTCFLYDLSPP